MCEWQEDLRVITVGSETLAVDGCIADEIVLLNGRGIRTINSCCGHGYQQGYINILPCDKVSRQEAEKVGYVIWEDDKGAVFLTQQGVAWGQGGCRPPQGWMDEKSAKETA